MGPPGWGRAHLPVLPAPQASPSGTGAGVIFPSLGPCKPPNPRSRSHLCSTVPFRNEGQCSCQQRKEVKATSPGMEITPQPGHCFSELRACMGSPNLPRVPGGTEYQPRRQRPLHLVKSFGKGCTHHTSHNCRPSGAAAGFTTCLGICASMRTLSLHRLECDGVGEVQPPSPGNRGVRRVWREATGRESFGNSSCRGSRSDQCGGLRQSQRRAEATGWVKGEPGAGPSFLARPSQHQAEFMQKGCLQTAVGWQGGAIEGPGQASCEVAWMAAGQAQSSVSCLMFSMETGSSGLGALSGVGASKCSSFTRTAMTKGGGGRAGRRASQGTELGRVGGLGIWLPTEGPWGGGVPLWGRQQKAQGSITRQQANCARDTGTCPPAALHSTWGWGPTQGPGWSCLAPYGIGVDVWEALQA